MTSYLNTQESYNQYNKVDELQVNNGHVNTTESIKPRLRTSFSECPNKWPISGLGFGGRFRFLYWGGLWAPTVFRPTQHANRIYKNRQTSNKKLRPGDVQPTHRLKRSCIFNVWERYHKTFAYSRHAWTVTEVGLSNCFFRGSTNPQEGAYSRRGLSAHQ